MQFLKNKIEVIRNEAQSVGLRFSATWPYEDMCYALISQNDNALMRLRAAANDASMMLTVHPASPERAMRIVAGSVYVQRANVYWINQVMQDNLSIIRKAAYHLGIIEERQLPTDGALNAFLREVASFHLPGESVHSKAKRCDGKLASKIVSVARSLRDSTTQPNREKLLKFADLCWRAPLDGLANEPAVSFIAQKAQIVFSSRIPEALQEEIKMLKAKAEPQAVAQASL